jgi:hypothetical protein
MAALSIHVYKALESYKYLSAGMFKRVNGKAYTSSTMAEHGRCAGSRWMAGRSNRASNKAG